MKRTLGEPRDIYEEREPDQGMETSTFLCVETRDGTSRHLSQDKAPLPASPRGLHCQGFGSSPWELAQFTEG